tara:strand:- start:453 stop:812 length:360 start_codon:yes stop_codon:yes gene_type:complete
MKKLLAFLTLLFLLMSIGLVFHIQFIPLEKRFLIQSYGVNTLLALIALVLLGNGIDKKKLNLAVLYLVTVALKFTVYVIFFYPRLHADGILERQEFFMFFVPYGLGLILEIMLLARSHN